MLVRAPQVGRPDPHIEFMLFALEAVRRDGLQRLRLDFADGHGYMLARAQRWRLWRRPLRELAAAQARRPAA